MRRVVWFLVGQKTRLEPRRCEALLSAAGVPVRQRLHFEGEEPSLLMHFRVLEAFDFCDDTSVSNGVRLPN